MTVRLQRATVRLETWVSWPHGLLSPFYLIDAIAMILLFWGAVHSLRARPRPAPEILCVAVAWATANGWRATFDRLSAIRAGGTLDHGAAEMWTVGMATAVGLTACATLLVLTVKNRRD